MLQEFVQEVKNYLHDTLRDVHTVIPARIVKFDPDKCEAAVLPYGKYEKPDGTKIDFPQINHVPVYFPQGMGQTASMVWKISEGDECQLFFSEQALDVWRKKAESDTDLRFDLTNAIAVVGLFSKANPLVRRAYDNESIIIQRENSFVELFDKKIEVETDGDIHVKAALNIYVNAGGDVNVTAAGNVNVKAATINLN